MNTSAVTSAVDFLAACDLPSVRVHAARTLGSPRRFGTMKVLRAEAERDMFARDVRELFLVPYAEAWRTGRLRGTASGVIGPVLSRNATVAMEALLARGCLEPSRPVKVVLDGMLERAHPRGFFYEPFQEGEAQVHAGTAQERRFVAATATYARFLLAFGRGRDERIRAAFDWLVTHQDRDGAWRPLVVRHEVESYLLTRKVAEAFAELPAPSLKRWGAARRRLASALAGRVLEVCDDPDTVLTTLNIAPDPQGPHRQGIGPEVPARLSDRILYFAVEDLALAIALGASPKHPHLAPWIEWLRDSQLADGSWRLGDPSLRERLLLSDPNGRLRAEALFLTDEWATLRSAQIFRTVHKRARTRVAVPAE